MSNSMQSIGNNSTAVAANSGCRGSSRAGMTLSSCQRQENWDDNEVMALIKSKHAELESFHH
jgi:hypothetical protein